MAGYVALGEDHSGEIFEISTRQGELIQTTIHFCKFSRLRHVELDPHISWKSFEDMVVCPPEVAAELDPGGEVVRVQGILVRMKPLVQSWALNNRAVTCNLLVGEERNLRGDGVHPEKSGLISTPDLAGPRWIRIDDVDGKLRGLGDELRGRGSQTLQSARSARASANNGNLGTIRDIHH